jgi:Secretion system C-terminal sorting domain
LYSGSLNAKEKLEFQVAIFPNPARNYLSFRIQNPRGGKISISFFEVDGKLLEKHELATDMPLFNVGLEDFKTGTYLYSCVNEHGESFSGKFSVIK